MLLWPPRPIFLGPVSVSPLVVIDLLRLYVAKVLICHIELK